jgi:hypothetical protein
MASPLPPIPIRIRFRLPDPIGCFLWEFEKAHMSVTKKDIVSELSLEVMPEVFQVCIASVGVPIPVTLYEFI